MHEILEKSLKEKVEYWEKSLFANSSEWTRQYARNLYCQCEFFDGEKVADKLLFAYTALFILSDEEELYDIPIRISFMVKWLVEELNNFSSSALHVTAQNKELLDFFLADLHSHEFFDFGVYSDEYFPSVNSDEVQSC